MKPQFLAERLNNIRLRWSGVAHRTIDDTGRRFPLTITLERVMCGSKEVRMKRIRVAWALFFAVGGCSSPHHHGMMDDKGDRYWQGQQELASLIDQTVKDPQKAQEVKKLAAEIVTELKTGREQEHAYHRQLHVLNSSYTATPEEFMKIIDEGNHQRMRTAAKILSLRFKMKDQMTADEWQVLSDRMRAYSGRYQHGGKSKPTE
jgi:hypothetical protein